MVGKVHPFSKKKKKNREQNACKAPLFSAQMANEMSSLLHQESDNHHTKSDENVQVEMVFRPNKRPRLSTSPPDDIASLLKTDSLLDQDVRMRLSTTILPQS